MMVSTFLMTFPNGHILYLGSWHRESHPTMVYEDENEPTTPSAGEQINQWHWGNGIDCQKCCSVCTDGFSLKTRRIPHILKQINNTHLRAVKKRFRFSKDTIWNTVGVKKKSLIIAARWVYMFVTLAPLWTGSSLYANLQRQQHKVALHLLCVYYV